MPYFSPDFVHDKYVFVLVNAIILCVHIMYDLYNLGTLYYIVYYTVISHLL
jgi:hypothetical protein